MNTFSFYQKVVALNSDVHRNLKFAAEKVDFAFARDTTSVLLAGVEFVEAGHEYPIVFVRGDDKKMRSVALLGVRSEENLFVDEQGKWNARYIPAFVRRYPFVMAEAEEGKLVVCIDEGCKALNSDHGVLMIDADGKLEPRMQEVMQFLKNFQEEFVRTESLIQQLDDLGLFVEQGARFDTGGGEVLQLSAFYLIDEVKLNLLEDDKLPALFRSGALLLAYLHLASLVNMRAFLDRLSAQPSKQDTTNK